MNRTDLALEIVTKRNDLDGVEVMNGVIEGFKYNRITLDSEGGRKISKPEGTYITLFCHDSDERENISKALVGLISPLVPYKGKILVAGLGNENITPDCLGVKTIKRTVATAHFSSMPDFKELSMREVYVLETGVLAQTGVESALQLKYLCDGIKPGAVIAVDSLACMETEKLGKTVQVTDSGISPGSGVKNMRNEISRKTLGVPVIAVGVPTVADTVSVLDGRLKDFGEFYDTVIVPRDIDILINRFAEIIADALNRVLNPSLSKEELERLTLF